MGEKCSRIVPSKGMGIQFHKCTRSGSVIRGGKWYCKQHDPVAVKAKHDERSRKWNDEWNAKAAVARRQSVCVNAMEGIPDPAKFIVDMQLAFQALRRGPELNMSNYRADDVAELNANATEAYLLMRPYLEAVVAKQALAAKPADPPKDTKCD